MTKWKQARAHKAAAAAAHNAAEQAAYAALAAAEAARDLDAIDEILAPQNYFSAGVVFAAFDAHERVRAARHS